MAEETNGRRLTTSELRAWIGAWVERTMGPTGLSAKTDQPFISLGLDSVHAMMLVGDLEEHLSRRLSPTLAWDYPTIEAMAAYLAGATPTGADPTSGTPNDDILARLDELPEEELDRLINERLNRKDPK